MVVSPPRSLERYGFAALALLTLAPVLVHGVWRPVAHALRVEVGSVSLTGSSLVVVGVTVLAHRVFASGRLSGAIGAVAAVLLGLVWAGSVGATVVLAGLAACGAVLLPWLLERLPDRLDGAAARRKGLAAVVILFGVATVWGTARLSTFMGDPTRSDLSIAPDVPFLVHHSCLTAYVEAVSLQAQGVDDLYDGRHWPDPGAGPRADAGDYAPFALDTFAYPPTFLLLPDALLSWVGDFASQRAVWFAANGLFLAAGLWIVARWADPTGVRALLFAPVVWMSVPTTTALQVGNVHVAVMVAAMLALVAFESRRPALGGALLAFAIASKISPGLIVVVLLVQRRYREVAWTAAFGAAFVGLAVLAYGTDPFRSFVSYELPRLASGEALAFLAWPESMAVNLAPFGVPFKLAWFGLEVGDPWVVGRVLNRVFSVGLLVVAVVGARQGGGPRELAQTWAALLTLASLRSPLAPGYTLFALVWLLSIRSVDVSGPAHGLVLAAIAATLALSPLHLTFAQYAVFTLFQTGVVLVVTVYLLMRPSRSPAPGRA